MTLILSILQIQANASENNLIFEITDESYEKISQIYENEYFLVSIYVLNNQNQPEYQTDVQIEFNNQLYNTVFNEGNPEIILQSPEVDAETKYLLKAAKDGYIAAYENITILNQPQLILVPEKYTVDAHDQFSILVIDENQNPVEDVIVGIQSYSGENSKDVTNANGRAWLTAPDNREEIIISAQKDGYTIGFSAVGIALKPDIIEIISKNPQIPVIISMLLLALAIIYTNQRQKIKNKKMTKLFNKNNSNRVGKINLQDKKNNICTAENRIKKTNQISIGQNQSPKIEEIRIIKSHGNKKLSPLVSNKLNQVKNEKNINRKYEWFEGTNNIRYEIDKITGEVDEKGKDKWFEGLDDIRLKVDEKIKKRDLEKIQDKI